MRALPAVALLSVGGVACTALAGLEPLDFVDDRADARPAEGGDLDAGGEAASRDARATPSDAGPDATGALGCLEMDAEFCDDFDHGALSVRWSFLPAPTGPCSISLANTQALSAPTALRAESLSNDAAAPQVVSALVQKDLPTFQGDYYVAFDVFFNVGPRTGGYLFKSALTPKDPNNNDAISPQIAAFPGDGGIELTAFNLKPFSGVRGEVLATVAVGQWIHVEGRVRRGADAGSTDLSFRVDGITRASRSVPTEVPIAAPTSLIGIESSGDVQEYYFDNVVMDTR